MFPYSTHIKGGINMDIPIHEYIPHWMSTIVESKTCNKCQCPSTRKDICAIGIRSFDQSNRTIFYVEHQCSECQTRIITSFGAQKTGSIEELCYLLLEQMQSRRSLEKSLDTKRSQDLDGIKDNEVESLLRFMNKNQSHEEFMRFIGIKQNDED